MGDSHRAKRRFKGYGPMRLLCAVLGAFRAIFVSCFSLLLPLMVRTGTGRGRVYRRSACFWFPERVFRSDRAVCTKDLA